MEKVRSFRISNTWFACKNDAWLDETKISALLHNKSLLTGVGVDPTNRAL